MYNVANMLTDGGDPGNATVIPTEETAQAIEWVDSAFEKLVRQAIGKPRGDVFVADLDGIESLNIWGDKFIFVNDVFPIGTIGAGCNAEKTRYVANGADHEWGCIKSLNDIKNFRYLERLTVCFNNIRDISVFSEITQFKSLNLSANFISDISPLKAQTQLEHLSLQNTSIADISVLAEMPALMDLDLSHCGIDDAKLAILAELTGLVALSMRDNPINDYSPISGLENLGFLYVSHVSDDDLAIFAGMTGLQYLFLSEMKTSDLTPLSNMKQLISLAIIRSNITDVSPLSGLKNLEYLDLSGSPVTDWSPVAHVKEVVGRP